MVKSVARFASIMPHWPGDPTKELTSFGGMSRSELMARVRGRGNATTELVVLSLLRRERIKGWRRISLTAGAKSFSLSRTRSPPPSQPDAQHRPKDASDTRTGGVMRFLYEKRHCYGAFPKTMCSRPNRWTRFVNSLGIHSAVRICSSQAGTVNAQNVA